MKHKLELVYRWCSMGPCPSLYKDDEGRYYIQGYVTSDDVKTAAGDKLPTGEDMVEVDQAFLEKLKELI